MWTKLQSSLILNKEAAAKKQGCHVDNILWLTSKDKRNGQPVHHAKINSWMLILKHFIQDSNLKVRNETL